MLDHFIRTVQKNIFSYELISPHSTILIGLSGGPDSVALLIALHELKNQLSINLVAAHLNHEWRAEAQQDAEFCRELCLKLSIPYVSAYAHELGLANIKRNEEAGRLLRRTFFEKVASEHHATAIALAHHYDDQQETFFIRLMRGSTLNGLIGMKQREGLYIRPLLNIPKDAILAYLKRINQPYTVDHTNDQLTYLRNRIRLHGLPALKSCDTRFEKSFAATLSHLQAAEETLTELTKTLYQTCKLNTAEGLHVLDLSLLMQHNKYMRNRILLMWFIEEKLSFTPTNAFFDEVNKFLQTTAGKDHDLHPNWTLRKRNKKIWILKKISEPHTVSAI